MSKNKAQFECESCGQVSPKWLGRCTGCNAWNSYVEVEVAQEGSVEALRSDFKAGVGWETLETKKEESSPFRLNTGLSELDRVLGGGLVADAFVLVGGDPGIGKSTLLLQVAQGLLQHPERKLKVLYASGEESLDQIRSRAERLGVEGKDRFFLEAEVNLERVLASVKELKPNVLFVDSLQTFSTNTVNTAPGSVSQVREVAHRLMGLAKTAGMAVVLVGHVTKEGAIAGPKVVEHLVDTVLYFEGEGQENYRLLRTVKNRFGSTNELGVFEMTSQGLQQVDNPSSLFLSERAESVCGTSIGTSLEGTRPLLVELQALVSPSPLAVPRRTAVGMDPNRLSLLAAILDRHLGMTLSGKDLFFNVAGGLKLSEPACDLAAAAAIWSSELNRDLPGDRVFIGELGLTGEVRRVSQLGVRLEEAKKLGFRSVVTPVQGETKIDGIEVVPIRRIEELQDLT